MNYTSNCFRFPFHSGFSSFPFINGRIHFFSETNTPISFKSPAYSQSMQNIRRQQKPLPSLASRSRALPCFLQGKTRKMERRLRITELVLRVAALGFSVLASALVGSDIQVRMFFSLEKRAKFTDMKALILLVVANGIAAGYNLFQVVRCFVGMMKGSALFDKGLALIIFACDQLMAYVALSVVAAAMQSAMIGKFGQSEFQWMKICNMYEKFCTQAGEGLGSAFVACMAMIVVSCISAFNVFRLYGSSKGWKNSNGSW